MRNDPSEDPKYPKVQFPSKYLCETCQLTNNQYDHSQTIEFLLNHYSKANIDKSVIAKKSSEDLPEYVIKKIDFVDRTGFSTHILQHLTVYVLLGVLIVLVVIRRRCCQAKGTRYRL